MRNEQFHDLSCSDTPHFIYNSKCSYLKLQQPSRVAPGYVCAETHLLFVPISPGSASSFSSLPTCVCGGKTLLCMGAKQE